ncbi:CubicO group peptidase, beta-lactamase class C family [Paenibacillus sp. yr247]|uniref:serine hydrolase domain-containing protein n=1 Tax=Paenibacillus sp. yr247 TaxID=1761880 RepID=UPI000888E469|nr:serine hydrolase [Paenibacillus sp. yr247]SDN41231.1 CubicO group peptidase, beta-lactamase class C family [Paenibacillus sp. yr247]
MKNKKKSPIGSGKGASTLSLSASGTQMKQVQFSQVNIHSERPTSKPADYWPTHGWKTTTPEAQGMNSAALAKMLEAFRNQQVHSVAVIRNGFMVTEAYNENTQVDIPQDVKSVTKSITSALVGIALSERKLKSTDQRLAAFFPELESDPLKSKIMLKHLLSMTSGMAWDNANERSSTEMMYSSDWVQYILECPAFAEPGTLFNYSNGDAHLLSAVVQKATGESMFDYAKSRLFGPLGITDVNWNHDPGGCTIGAWAIALTLRDMAKIGYLYLKEGQWEDKTIIPEPWIRESLIRRVTLNYSNGTQGGYGFYWWSKTLPQGLLKGSKKQYEMFYASGSGGRRIFVVPELQLVVAVTADSADVDMPEELMHLVVQAIRGDKPFQENSAASAELDQAINSFKLGVES